MNNDPWAAEREEIVKSDLLTLYNIIDWIDFGLVFAIIFYVANAARDAGSGLQNIFYPGNGAIETEQILNVFSLPPSVIGLLLCVASLAVSVSAIIVSRLIHKKGANKSRLRLIVRYIVWGVWIPIDLYFIVVYAVGLLGQA